MSREIVAQFLSLKILNMFIIILNNTAQIAAAFFARQRKRKKRQSNMTIRQIAFYLARKLRKNQTTAESVLWHVLRNKQFNNCKFLRQHPIFYTYGYRERFFIADFYCRRLQLVIEIDGGIHDQQSDYDRIRSELLSIQHNLRIVRFTNDEITGNLCRVIKQLEQIFSQ